MTVLGKLLSRMQVVQPDDEHYKFSEEQLTAEIEDACTYAFPEIEDIETLTKVQQLQVLNKAKSSCYFILAGRHAENMRFRIENDEYHGDQVHANYLSLANKFQEAFENNLEEIIPEIEVNTVTRRQTGTNRKAPYYQGDTP